MALLAALVAVPCLIAATKYYWAPVAPDSRLRLQDFRLRLSVKIPDTVNLSGITYSSHTDTLFAVTNNPETILELDKAGTLLRSISLPGFEDAEGIVHLGGAEFLVTQERRRQLSRLTIDPETASISLARARTIQLAAASAENNGFEGVARNDVGEVFIALEERPSQVLHLNSLAEPDKLEVLFDNLPLGDIAGLHYDIGSHRLLVLSDRSRQIIEISRDGKIHSRLNFNLDWFGFDYLIEQPEGITMDNNHDIYVVGEPNQLLVLSSDSR